MVLVSECRKVIGSPTVSGEEPIAVNGPKTPLLAPFPLLLAGMTLVAAAWLIGAALEGSLPVLRVSLLVLGVIAAGAAVAAHLRYARADLEGRLGSAALWLLATATLFVAWWALDPAWDSLALLLSVLMVVGVVAAIVTVLPQGWRRLAFSLIILFHFGAILNAIAVVPPRGGETPWLAVQTWTRLYRPYLMFTRLDDAYHYGAPEPGPCTVLWFRIAFADGASRWMRLPDHNACRNHVERRRLGALAAAIGQTVALPHPRTADERLYQEHVMKRRLEAGANYNPPIPIDDSIPLIKQFREPTIEAKMLLASYVRYVARTAEHPLGHASPVSAVKVYRVECYWPPVEQFQAGRSPRDPTLYQAWYQGEYEADGRLKENVEIVRNAKGEQIGRIQDPLLYWLIPIARVPDESGAARPPELPGLPHGARRSETPVSRPWTREGKVINFVRIHAGDQSDEQ
jgi:hypothetical protein